VPAVKGIGLDANGNVWMPAARRRRASLGSGAAGGRVLRFDERGSATTTPACPP